MSKSGKDCVWGGCVRGKYFWDKNDEKTGFYLKNG